jgi:hypothetical protein
VLDDGAMAAPAVTEPVAVDGAEVCVAALTE